MRKRMIDIRKIAIAGLVLSISFSAFSGCALKSDTPIVGKLVGLKSDEMFKIDKLLCSKAEYMLVMMNTANQYKSDFGGNIDWNANVNKDLTMTDFVKDKVKEDITMKYALSAMAEKNGVSLTNKEKAEIQTKASDYYKALTDGEKKYTGAEEKDVENLYTNYMLADKVYSKITENVGNDISEEDARVIKIQYIRMNTESKKAAKIKSTLKDVKSIVEGGYQEFAREAKQYSLDDTIERVMKKSEAASKYELEAFKVSKGKISNIIEDGNNYYLIYCIDNYMKDETAKNKQELMDKEKQQYFNKEYTAFLNNIETDFNEKEEKKIKIEDSDDMSSIVVFD